MCGPRRSSSTLGFAIAATHGTADHLEGHGVPVAQRVAKVTAEGEAPDPAEPEPSGLPTAVDLIAAGKVALVVNSPRGRGPRADGAYIRRAANVHRIPCLTTAAAAIAAAESTVDRSQHQLRVRTLQEYHGRAATTGRTDGGTAGEPGAGSG